MTDDGLHVLVVDDEVPARDELVWLLERDELVAAVTPAESATEALRLLHDLRFDAVLLDISMPGLDGIELAAVLRRFKEPPPIVFVTAHEQHAVEAFELQALDYVLKPVREERLARAVRRIAEARDTGAPASPAAEHEADADPGDVQIAVERAGVMRFVNRSDITHVEAQGDYARLHVGGDSYLVRIPLAQLADDWGPAGFARIHRSTLVSLGHVEELRTDAGRCSVVVRERGGAGVELAVSRRHARELRDLLLRIRT